MAGWIKIHGKIKDNWVWKNPIYLKGWLYILIEASYNDDDNIGQLMLPIGKLAKEMGCNYFTAYRFVQKLQSDGMVVYGEKDSVQSKMQNKVQKLTICKYEEYQVLVQSNMQSKTQNRVKENAPIPLKENNNITCKEIKKYPPIIPPKGYESFDFSFIEEGFSKPFLQWLDYKRDRKEKYKSQKSMEIAYSRMKKLSDNNPDTAMMIIEESMANNWQGMFALRESQHTNQGMNTGVILKEKPKYTEGW